MYELYTLKIESFSLNFAFQPYFFAKETSITFLITPFGFDLSYLTFKFFLPKIKFEINSK